MTAIMPFTGLSAFRREMDRLFDRITDDRENEFPVVGDWIPPLDLHETHDAVTVRMDVPGLEPKDLHLTLQENLLTIRGERLEEKETKVETTYRTERRYGSFTRAIRLPSMVNPDKVNATFRNGVLNITMPKLPEAKGTEIPVKTV